MIDDMPPVTLELLNELGVELGGCDFTGDSQVAFLFENASCDVQAAPGNGKTTLLVAKLALLSRVWSSRQQGVCVISHTNAAREEVERKLSSHPSASAFLGYPHFIGTVTSFIDRFIALPYLRGLGWAVQRIDDEVFAAVAGARWAGKPALAKYGRMRNGVNRHALLDFVANLELAEDFACEVGVTPARLTVRHRYRQPRAPSETGIALEELKADITNEGYYRFGDMLSLAHKAMEESPALIERLRTRFPLVLLDEAQDTNGAQLALLDTVFGEGVAYQRLGDQNQTLYEDSELGDEEYWSVGGHVIPLNETRRFGPEIAAFASRLTVRSPQAIEGKSDVGSSRCLFLFDQDTIENVLPAYAIEVRHHYGDAFSVDLSIYAVASRHNPASDRGSHWPKTLIDYHKCYRSGRGHHSKPDSFCSSLRQAALVIQNGGALCEAADLITTAVVQLLRLQGVTDSKGRLANKRNFARLLAMQDANALRRMRRLIRDSVLFGNAAWISGEWEGFCHEAVSVCGFQEELSGEAAEYLAFVDQGEVEDGADPGQSALTIFEYDGIKIQLGSIHSVKGKTVDAILAVETEIWRGPSKELQVMDLATVLPHAFGVEDRDFTKNAAQLAGATNIFVAATRPRQFLGFALRKEAVDATLADTARAQGWSVVDLTGQGR